MTVEVGPIPQGCLYAETYLVFLLFLSNHFLSFIILLQETKAVLERAFEFIEKHNAYVDSHPDLPSHVENTSMDVFQRVGSIDFPRNNHAQIVGMVHNDLQVCLLFSPPLLSITCIYSLFQLLSTKNPTSFYWLIIH